MTDLERKNLRRAMYSREAVRTEDEEEGERSEVRARHIRTAVRVITSVFIVWNVCKYQVSFFISGRQVGEVGGT